VKIRRLTFLSLSVALSLVISYLESLIPYPWLPGMKLGLANIVTVWVLYCLSPLEALIVSALRVSLSALLFGSAMSLAYAAAGAAVSLLMMFLLSRTGRFSPWSVSVAGGVGHNIAQVFVAMLVFRQSAVLSLLPWLFPAGIVSGLCVGVLAAWLVGKSGKLHLHP